MSSHNSESEVSDTELEMSKKASTEPERKRGRPKKLSLKDLPPKDQEKVKERFAKARLEGEAGVRNKMKILKQMEVDEKHIKLDEAINARAERIAELRRQKEEEQRKAIDEQQAVIREKAKEVPVKSKPVITDPDEEEVEIEYRKAKPKPKKKRIVYVEESSSEEEEIVVKKKPKVKAKPKKVVEEEEEDENLVKQEIVKREVKDKVDKMRDEVLRSYMNSFFPRM